MRVASAFDEVSRECSVFVFVRPICFFFFICLRLSLSDPNCTSASIHVSQLVYNYNAARKSSPMN